MSALLLLSQIRQLGKSYETLRDLVKPASANQPESIPHVLFDTQTYAQAGSAALNFFRSTAANLGDTTLSNFASGQLETYQFFEIHRVHVFIHSVPNAQATAAITGAAQDVELLHKTARGILSFSLGGKPYGGFPLTYFGRPGGPLPTYFAYGTGAVANNVITAGQTEANGGFPYLGNLIIPPASQFSATMTFNSTAISAATNITLSLLGVLHRQVR
jgi:hypothetical protein